jgi:glycerophosphoryl diester phosphodiesterase
VVHPFFRSDRRLVFAHRGGASLAPENTIAAFDAGLAAGADGLEIDVHLSRDCVVVVSHDRTLDRTTNLRGDIGQFTARELLSADAGFRFARNGVYPFRGQGIGVPALTAVLERYRDTRLIIEMKGAGSELALATVAAVRGAGALDRVCLGSFRRTPLRTVRETEPAIATSAARIEVRWALYRSRLRWPVRRPAYQAYQVPEISRDGARVVSPRFVTDAHQAGLAVQVWTVDREEDAHRLLGWGVDAIITDRPDVIVPVVRAADRS